MKPRTIEAFDCELKETVVTVDSCHDNGRLDTLQGEYKNDYEFRGDLLDAIGPRENSDPITFVDTDKNPESSWLLDRYEDATNGINPGNPWVKSKAYEDDTPIEEILGHDPDEVERRLDRFFAQTNTRPHPTKMSHNGPQTNDVRGESAWGGAAYKFFGNIEMPHEGAEMRSFLHELGHCSMGVVSFSVEITTKINTEDVNDYHTHRDFSVMGGGLQFTDNQKETRGIILEEGVAEAIGSLVNKKLGLVVQDTPGRTIPDKLKPYIINGNFSYSSPSAVALELIADEIGMPFEQYLKLFTDYANAGVNNMDARQEVAETIYRGTRGKIKMSQVEGLPYPTYERASLAFLWAVEDALDIPDKDRYSKHFFAHYS